MAYGGKSKVLISSSEQVDADGINKNDYELPVKSNGYAKEPIGVENINITNV